jgi:hypothetical protein
LEEGISHGKSRSSASTVRTPWRGRLFHSGPCKRFIPVFDEQGRLQREQAVCGRYDVTTFLEGTTFPLGSQTFDDRHQGWTIGDGINVQLNDRRLRSAIRSKAESQIRQLEARMEAEEIAIHQRIVSNTTAMLDNDQNRKQLGDTSLAADVQHAAGREVDLSRAIGQDYKVVGLKIDGDAKEMPVPSEEFAKTKPVTPARKQEDANQFACS